MRIWFQRRAGLAWLGMLLCLCTGLITRGQDLPPVTNGWALFSQVKYTQRFFKEYNEYFLVPFFDTRIQQYKNQEILLKGHYMPLDLEEKNVIVLSKFPYSACFFCGGAGPESVAEIHFRNKPPRFKTDEVLQVSGRLMLNADDVNHMNFILKDAELITP
ncbi:DUF3299 domain-containing protein [Dawidia soli]|uniref:DUF3299 domain-containing protein n=1 Tax=Dawidia soli TaxID=2782352 RepID=A0AAP2DBF3_9BACT|nr:DUF3299 domain-containing protein [Dawidia soli]MBT1688016.1 DUF3299 domain-containing protein [Dawidia soli]